MTQDVSSRRHAFRWATIGTSTGVALLAVVLYVVAMPQQPRTARRYVPILSFQALPYEGTLTLRGDSPAKGQQDFDSGIKDYLQGDYKQATKLIKRAVERTDDRAEWWLYLGVCNYLQHDADPAIKALCRADNLAQGGLKVQTRWFLAQSYLLEGDRKSAEPMLEWVSAQNKDRSNEAFALLSKLRQPNSAGETGEK
jgi:Flp pilus assembly protein TadD